MRLNGAYALFGGQAVTLASLEFNGGELEANNGTLTVNALADPATITLTNCCDLTLPNTTQPVSIVADDGLGLLGNTSDLNLIAQRQAEVVLGTTTTVPAGRTLEIDGGRATVGWDGTGAKTLTIAGTLRLRVGVAAVIQVDEANSEGELHKTLHTRMARSNGLAKVGGGWTAKEADCHRWLRHTTWSSARDQLLWMCSVGGVPQAGDSFTYSEKVVYPAYRAPQMAGVPTVTQLVARVVSVESDLPKLQIFRSGAVDDGVTEPTATAIVTLTGAVEMTGMDLLDPGIHEWTCVLTHLNLLTLSG